MNYHFGRCLLYIIYRWQILFATILMPMIIIVNIENIKQNVLYLSALRLATKIKKKHDKY